MKINDPVHGFIIFPEFIGKIVDSPEIQRLRNVRQLAGASYVFPGANHTRFEHSLGVANLASRLMNYLVDYHHVQLSKEDINDCIVAALCHDIGHGPFSHNFESILLKHLQKDHEDYTHWIISKSEIGDILNDLGFDKEYIANLAVGRTNNKKFEKAFLISQIISSAVNVDSMDYLMRDNYHCGTKGISIDTNRLLLAIEEIENGLIGVDIRALNSLEGFLLARISSFRTIYFHKTCRAVQLMISAAIDKMYQCVGLLDYKTPQDYIAWDDYTLWTALCQNSESNRIMQKLKYRQLLKLCYESKAAIDDFKMNRDELIEEISAISGIPQTEFFIDTPSSPNVPYGHIAETRSNEIITFAYNDQDQKVRVNIDNYSLFFNQFKGHLNLLRIYTWPQFREKITLAAKKILGKPSTL